MERLLYIGCTPGNDVVMLQADLNSVRHHVGQGSAYEPLVTDGIFGAKSHNRVSEFQRINRLTADGIAGPLTKGKLQELLLSQPGLQQPGGGVAPGTAQGASAVSKPVPATKGGQSYGKMPALDGSSRETTKSEFGGFGGQAKGDLGGTSQQQYTGFGKMSSGGNTGGGGKYA